MPLKVAITGSTGIIGSTLREAFLRQGHSVTAVIRPSTHLKVNQKVIRWNPEAGRIEKNDFEGYDCIIHLSGASIAGGRWSEKYKKEILESRDKGTRILASAVSQLKSPPRLFLCASAVGYYGTSAFSDVKSEAASKGNDFLSDVCQAWENALEPARQAGVRTVCMRLGMVLDKKGGALAKMLPIFRLGLGGKLGSGSQPISWIAAEEISSVILHLINHPEISGAVNFTAPQTVSNAEFTKILAQAIHRPAIFPVPSVVLKVLFGEMANSLLLGGQNAAPQKLLASGYRFKFPNLKDALESIFQG